MVASPYVAKRHPDGTTVTHFGVSVRTAYLNPPLALVVRRDSVILYRFRQERREENFLVALELQMDRVHPPEIQPRAREVVRRNHDQLIVHEQRGGRIHHEALLRKGGVGQPPHMRAADRPE